MPMRRERLTPERIVGDISLVIFLSTVVGIGSRSQDELHDLDSNSTIVISSMVAGLNEVSEAGVRVVSDGQGWENGWF